eukprot:Skav218706  [mRNA]  locus=scaffold1346:431206:432378:- [translate_table: standard]
MKANTILSLSGIMKKSDTMLILWDPTWTERLWCLVELAAFLKSQNNPDENLIVIPIFLGHASMIVSWVTALGTFLMLLPGESMSIQTRTILLPPFSDISLSITFLLCAFIAAYAAVNALRSYFRSVESMQQRLLSISFDETRCSCCDRNHVSPTGKPMLCDRKVFSHCIIHWFGGQESFEDILRSEVRKRMAVDLRESLFSNGWVRTATRPFMLGYVSRSAMDIMPTFDKDPARPDNAGSHLILAVGIWLLFPQFVHLVTCICRHMHSRPDGHRLEFAKNAGIVAALGIPILGVMACIVWINGYPGLRWKTETWHQHLNQDTPIYLLGGMHRYFANSFFYPEESIQNLSGKLGRKSISFTSWQHEKVNPKIEALPSRFFVVLQKSFSPDS